MNFEIVQGIDLAILNFFQSIQQPSLTILFQALSLLGNPVTWIILAALLYWHGKEIESVLLMNLIVFSALASNALKAFFQQPRPDSETFKVTKELGQDFFEKVGSYGFSFPSGHMTLIASILGYWYFKVSKYFQWILIFSFIAVFLARQYLGWHYFTDVLAGIILGLGIAYLNTFLVYEIKQKQIHFESLKTQRVLAVVFLCLLFLYYLGINKLTFAILGFYTGFFFFKKFKLAHTPSTLKQITGCIGLGIIGTAYVLASTLSILWMFLLGFWITFGNPLLYRILQRKK